MPASHGIRGRGWVGLLIVLLAMSSQPGPAQAEAGFEKYVFYLAAKSSRSMADLCVGDRVTIDVTAERFHANRRGSGTDQTTNPPVQVFGVTLNGAVGNPAIGSLTPPSQVTSAGAAPPGSAQFAFTAKEAGSTEIVFKGIKIETGWFLQFVNGNKEYLSTTLEATVKDCQYDVTVASQWNGFNLEWLGILDAARLSSSDGQKYTGSGTWTWVITEDPGDPGCAPHTLVLTSEADLTGELDGDRLIVDVAYRQAKGYLIGHMLDCTTPQGRETLTQVPGPLTFTVPASGGRLLLPHTLVDEAYAPLSLSGDAAIVVVPVTQP